MNVRGRIRRLQSDLLDAFTAGPPSPLGVDATLRVLFVCYGNSCRSPLAEGIFREKLAKAGLLGAVAVESAGTNAGDPGAPPDWRARRVARQHGVSISDVRARRFETADFDRFDIVLALDKRNRDSLLSMARSDRDRSKVRLLRDADGEIVDPVHGTFDDFEQTFQQIDEACERLFAEACRAFAG
jgi:protein-tyrosine phosphatase